MGQSVSPAKHTPAPITTARGASEANVVDALIPFLGAYCFVCSCYTEYPACMGVETDQTICCLLNELRLCKPSTVDNRCLQCVNFNLEVVPFGVCVKSRSQVCCIDSRISLPPDDEVPALLTCFFWTCAYKHRIFCRCCSKLGDIDRTYRLKMEYPADA